MERSHNSYIQNFDALPDSATAVWENGTSCTDDWFVQRTKSAHNTIVANNGVIREPFKATVQMVSASVLWELSVP